MSSTSTQIQLILMKKDFSTVSIVSITGFDMDFSWFKYRESAPTFYGMMEDDALFLRDKVTVEGSVLIRFIVSDKYE